MPALREGTLSSHFLDTTLGDLSDVLDVIEPVEISLIPAPPYLPPLGYH
jgi:hypothetical protein